jgi:predicted membrane protein
LCYQIKKMESENYKRNPSNKKISIGLFLIAGGILLLIHKMGVVMFPAWFFTWPMLIIAIGLLAGLQHNFRWGGWLFLIAWGVFWMIDQQDPSLNLKNYTAPVALIFLGLFFILRRKHPRPKDVNDMRWKIRNDELKNIVTDTDDGEFIDSTSVFSGAKKMVISKNFRGGDITCFMGGAEIDLSQADIQTKAKLDATAVFGGIKIIVPSNWDLKIENNGVFGSVEDKRKFHTLNADPSKQLIIDGTAVFGGIEINNY